MLREHHRIQLKTDAQTAARTAREIAEKADREGRTLTAAERAEYDQHMAKGRELIAQLKADDKDRDVTDQAKALAAEVGGARTTSTTSPNGSPMTAMKSRAEWGATALKSVRTAAGTERAGIKALVSGTIGVPDPISPEVVAMPSEPRTILDLLRGGTGTRDGNAAYTYETAEHHAGSLVYGDGDGRGNTYSFLRQTVRENNAAPVPDGAQKPTSLYTLEEVEGRYRVIAHLSEPVPQRYFHDDASLGTFLATEMANGLEDELQAQALNGDGTGENFTGILHTSGIQAQAWAGDLFKTTRQALTKLQVYGIAPTAWALNPVDAEAFDLLREGTAGDGAFLLGGPGTSAGTTGLWNLPRVASTAVPQGSAVLADWTAARLLTRQEATLHVDAGGEHFQKNTAQFRLEGRYGLAVQRPAAFVSVDLTA